ncbi:ImpB/MucB/SamB family protein [Ancylostoma caninum]|uniref:DNA-directed DNA polymerase n=1 Tax=Ancylostoma caninum TaxID=29170 RepID=A0A368GET0_ANCCA|nr:ImpB/MucB/SamB family protein [Ancylostoma caninum]
MGSLDEAYLELTACVTSRTEPKTFVRRQYGGECICRLPLIAEEEAAPSSVEKCTKCGKEQKIFEDEVEFGTSRAEVVREIRFRVEQATGLTCSAGIAPNFMLAKICSDMNKPNGQFELENSYASVMEFLNPLPIRKVAGIGRVSEALLNACGIKTVGELLERRAALKFSFSPLSQESFLRIALGLPGRPSASDPRRKSISVERTFTPISDRDGLLEVMEKVCDMLIEDMPTAGIVGGRCVTLKLKLSSFDVLTRSITPGRLVSTTEDILAIAREALDRELPNEIRLLGIRLSNLQFIHDRPSDNTVSVLDFWKKRQELDVAAIEDSEANTESSSSLENTVICPICNVPLKNDDRLVNQHVDECLNSAVLVDSPRPNQDVKPTRKRKTTLETFFAKKDRR